MKIKVHEIEGDYYCAIDDIAVISRAESGLSEALKLFQRRAVYAYVQSLHRITVLEKYKSTKTPWVQAWYVALFLSGIIGVIIASRVKIDGIQAMSILEKLQHTAPYLLIVMLFVFSLSITLFHLWRQLEIIFSPPQALYVNTKPLGYANNNIHEDTDFLLYSAQGLVVSLADAQIYLSPYENIDFIMPDSEPTTPKTEPIAEQPTADESETIAKNRLLLIKFLMGACQNYEEVLNLAGKKEGDKISQANIIDYIENYHPLEKGKGISKRSLEEIFSEANKIAS